MMTLFEFGRPFVKMSGSGNDFIFFDARSEPVGDLARPEQIAALCARGTGIGADGVVFLEPAQKADFAIRYFNPDGSLASLCGNASLCSVRLATELGAARPDGMTLETGAGVLSARMREGLPEIDLPPVASVQPAVRGIEPTEGEARVGFAVAGVPHLVVLCGDASAALLEKRGPALRHHPTLREGANVNWVSPQDGGWRMRTYERGVEGETLACGTGAVAVAVLLATWGEADPGRVALATSSGLTLEVALRQTASGWWPSLRGEGRVVFSGRLGEL